MSWEVINGEALAEMSRLAERGVRFDACITDPPYGTTACAWDAVIPFAPMWANLKRLVKRDGAIVLFGSQPFTSALVMSNPGMFKYEWVWRKNTGSGIANAAFQPMKYHENVCVFYQARPTYNPQPNRRFSEAAERTCKRLQRGGGLNTSSHIPMGIVWRQYDPENKTPESVIEYESVPNAGGIRTHPTEKPVELMRYLVRTYTNPGDTVLDFTAGSGSTGVACVIEGRHFIGIELDAHYCEVAEARMKRASGTPADIPRPQRRQIETPLFGGLT